MQISIAFDPSTELDEVSEILVKLGGEAAAVVATPTAAAKKAVAKKAAAKAPEPEPEEDEDDDADLIGEDEDEPEAEAATMADAVKLATALVNGGEGPRVKAALNERSAKRVSELKPKDIQSFVDELTD